MVPFGILKAPHALLRSLRYPTRTTALLSSVALSLPLLSFSLSTPAAMAEDAGSSVIPVDRASSGSFSSQAAAAILTDETGSLPGDFESGPAVITLDVPSPGVRNPDTAAAWRAVVDNNPRVHEINAFSPSMQRHVPLVLIEPDLEASAAAGNGSGDPAEPRPTLYLFNGADGGEGTANWLLRTDVVDFFADKGTNVIIPMAGAFSYYTDWVESHDFLDAGKGHQRWETFFTRELPGPLEEAINGNGRRAIAGMSMSATTSLLYAEKNPGFYQAVGSFSGCASTTEGLGDRWVRLTLQRGKATYDQMWGDPRGEYARSNDAMLNAHRLAGQENIYISTGTGIMGEWDLPSSPTINGNLAAMSSTIVEGGFIEGATNSCTRQLKKSTDRMGIPITYNLRPTGTHQWGYWQDDLRSFWPVLQNGLFG